MSITGMIQKGRSRRSRGGRGPGALLTFSAIGLACTVAFALLYSWFRTTLDPIEANLAAISLTMVANFAANRRFTFDGAVGSLPTQAAHYTLVYSAGLLVSTLLLRISLLLVSNPAAFVETSLAVASGLAATIIRFLMLSHWVFRRPDRGPVAEGAARAA